jgi:hypothetical protein
MIKYFTTSVFLLFISSCSITNKVPEKQKNTIHIVLHHIPYDDDSE